MIDMHRDLLRNVSLVLLLLVLSCRGERAEPQLPRFENAPVIIISIDTLRADHLPAWGYEGVATPAIDSLRGDSLLFRNAYSHCPLTLPSHLSVLTGLLPQEHGVRDNIGFHFDGRQHPTLASLLGRRGYDTGAAVSAYVLRGSTGIADSFDRWDDAIPVVAGAPAGSLQRDGRRTEAVAEAWIGERGNRPFFFLLHLFEPHSPYDPPEKFKKLYPNAYDGEIAAADEVVGRFLGFLRSRGLYDRALIILMSDHGEGLMDHGEEEHGILLYREAIHVPLMVKLPGGELGGRTVETPAQLIDILPTVVGSLGITPPAGLRGESLVKLAIMPPQPERRVFSETFYPRIHLGWSELRSLADARHHFIDAPAPELYDLESDPAERASVLADQRRVYASMRKEIEELGREGATPGLIDPEEAKKLAALGYVSSVAGPVVGALPDPKDRIAEIEAVKRAFRMAADRQYRLAIPAMQSILVSNPGWGDVWNQLALAYEEMGQYENAARTYRSAIAAAPTLASELALSLAAVLEKLQQYDEAEKQAALAMKHNPAGAHELLGHIALQRGDAVRAEREAREAIDADSTHRPRATLLLAQALAARGSMKEALALVENLGNEVDAGVYPPIANLEYVRGDILARMDRHREAKEAFRAEIASFPHNRRAYANLALVSILGGDMAGGHEALEGMVRANPGRESCLFAARTLETLGDREGAGRWRRRAESLPGSS